MDFQVSAGLQTANFLAPPAPAPSSHTGAQLARATALWREAAVAGSVAPAGPGTARTVVMEGSFTPAFELPFA